MKKFIVTMIAIVMALSLVACGKAAAPEQTQPDQKTTAQAAEQAQPEKDTAKKDSSSDKQSSKTTEKKQSTTKKDTKQDEKISADATNEDVAESSDTESKQQSTPSDQQDKTELRQSDETERQQNNQNERQSSQPEKKSTPAKKADSSSDKQSSKTTEKKQSSTKKDTTPVKKSDSDSKKQSTPKKDTTPKHTHSYSSKTVAPTCTKDGYTKHTCSCGDSYKDSYTDALGHDWKKVYKTVTVDDYETKCVTRCVTCGKELSGQEVIDHSYYHLERGESDQQRETYEKVKVGSHTEKELVGYECSRCGATK